MSEISFEAVFEAGVLKPTQPLPGLKDGEKVHLALKAQDEDGGDAESEFWRTMKRLGAVDEAIWARQPAQPFEPVVITGPPLSETVLEERG